MSRGVDKSVESSRVSGLRWLGISLATLAFGLPAIAFLVALALVDGHADIAYFEAIAQIIPIVILALAIELRYFAPGRELPAPLKLLFRDPFVPGSWGRPMPRPRCWHSCSARRWRFGYWRMAARISSS